ncbi:ketosteroid isomerase-like protein [Mucilaginibacter sp. UYP25]|uniref:YybH family protein n=1 Tax=unclassified Mucilaginibacter TaxID=2617802 RepID=UPI0033917A95
MDNKIYFNLFKKKDTAIVGLYTHDAWLMPPNTATIRGKAALMKDFQDTYNAGQVLGVKFSTIDIYGNNGEFITEIGNWQVFGSDGKVIDKGKYLKLWKNTVNGWKIYRDVFNSDQERLKSNK